LRLIASPANAWRRSPDRARSKLDRGRGDLRPTPHDAICGNESNRARGPRVLRPRTLSAAAEASGGLGPSRIRVSRFFFGALAWGGLQVKSPRTLGFAGRPHTERRRAETLSVEFSPQPALAGRGGMRREVAEDHVPNTKPLISCGNPTFAEHGGHPLTILRRMESVCTQRGRPAVASACPPCPAPGIAREYTPRFSGGCDVGTSTRKMSRGTPRTSRIP
jgi:hypothetical protein